MQNRYKITAGVWGGLVALLGMSAPAGAHHNHTVPDPDDRNHGLQRDFNGHGEAHDGVGWGGTQLDRSVLNMDYNDAVWHDVRAHWEFPGNPAWVGSYQCMSSWPNGRCDTGLIRMNNRPQDLNNHDVNYWKSLGCHEVGHSGGISERGDQGSCMDATIQNWNDPVKRALDGAHDLVHIDADN